MRCCFILAHLPRSVSFPLLAPTLPRSAVRRGAAGHVAAAAPLGQLHPLTDCILSVYRQTIPNPRPPPCPAVLSDEVPLVISRQLLLLFAQGVAKLPPPLHVQVATA